MAESKIPVDLFNPGQVFACLGFMELADVLLGDVEGKFDWSSGETSFLFRANGEKSPVNVVLDFVKSAQRYSVSPDQTVQERDGGDTRYEEGVHPSKLRHEGKLRNALLPIDLCGDVGGIRRHIRLDYWTDLDSGRPIIRLWTATNGNSASVRFGKLHEAYLKAIENHDEKKPDPFSLLAPVAANFRLEPRRNWASINLGFSPDTQKKACKAGEGFEVLTCPVVEIFSVLALTNARPELDGKNPAVWHFSAWQTWLPIELARIAIAQKLPVADTRNFVVHLEEPNDGGDLSMTYATEELSR
jgi:CRISPR-associated protein Csx14